MDMRIVGVPVVDGNPVESGGEIALGFHHHLTCERAEILHVSRILR